MKKVILGIAIVLGMMLAVSCGCNQTRTTVVEEEVVDTLQVADSTVVATDTLVVVE